MCLNPFNQTGKKQKTAINELAEKDKNSESLSLSTTKQVSTSFNLRNTTLFIISLSIFIL